MVTEEGYLVLRGLCSSHGVQPSDLDDLVHECAVHADLEHLNGLINAVDQEAFLTDRESLASKVNNQGWEAQLRFIHNVLGDDAADERISGLIMSFDEGPSP